MRGVWRHYGKAITSKLQKGADIMPRGDRTGPLGMGERTGRAAGFCAGFDMPGYANQAPGRGFGRGRGGGGSGRRNAPYAPPAASQNPDPELTRQLLKRQAEDLQSELEMVKKRLAEVEEGRPVQV
jgi:hypothetical protein